MRAGLVLCSWYVCGGRWQSREDKDINGGGGRPGKLAFPLSLTLERLPVPRSDQGPTLDI